MGGRGTQCYMCDSRLGGDAGRWVACPTPTNGPRRDLERTSGGGVLALLLLVHPEGIQVSKQPFWHHHFLPLPKGTQTPGRLVPP